MVTVLAGLAPWRMVALHAYVNHQFINPTLSSKTKILLFIILLECNNLFYIKLVFYFIFLFLIQYGNYFNANL